MENFIYTRQREGKKAVGNQLNSLNEFVEIFYRTKTKNDSKKSESTETFGEP